MPSVATGSDDKITLRVVSWNAASVLPESHGSKYTNKLRDKVKLLPWVPDLILLQETWHIKKNRAGVVNREQTDRKIQAIAPLLGEAYEFHAARVAQSTQDATHCHGTGLFIRKESVLYGRGRFWQPPWDEDEDGHVCGWEAPEGLIVGAYMPTPTAKSRSGGPAQSAVRAKYDANLRNELVERQADLLCVLGDFNVTLHGRDCSGDLWTGPAYTQTRDRFRDLLTVTSLVDAFRARRPTEERYTSFQQRTSGWQGLFQARVDLCLLPQRRMADELVDVDILDEDGKFTTNAYTKASRSDHVPLVAVLRLQRCRTPPPPPDKGETGARGAGGRGGGGRGVRERGALRLSESLTHTHVMHLCLSSTECCPL